MRWTRPRALQAVSLFICSLLYTGAGLAQSGNPVSIVPRPHPETRIPAGDAPQAHLRVDSSLVQIPVNVTTTIGTPVTDLKKEHFEILEDGVPQKIASFTMEDAPVSVGLLFDTSGSMHNKMQRSSEAAARFFKTANAEDEFFLVEFDEKPRLSMAFTADSDEIYKKILHTHPFGRTSLLDAIHMAMVHMKRARNSRKVLVIVSDGGDNRSRFSAREIKNDMLESDVQLYAMGIFDRPDPGRNDAHKRSVEEENGPQLLDDLASQTGGRTYVVENPDQLSTISARISTELRNQYSLGYFSTNQARDGKYRRVKLKLTPPSGVDLADLRIRHRQGYYAPVQ